jgi:hypothetical protein
MAESCLCWAVHQLVVRTSAEALPSSHTSHTRRFHVFLKARIFCTSRSNITHYPPTSTKEGGRGSVVSLLLSLSAGGPLLRTQARVSQEPLLTSDIPLPLASSGGTRCGTVGSQSTTRGAQFSWLAPPRRPFSSSPPLTPPPRYPPPGDIDQLLIFRKKAATSSSTSPKAGSRPHSCLRARVAAQSERGPGLRTCKRKHHDGPSEPLPFGSLGRRSVVRRAARARGGWRERAVTAVGMELMRMRRFMGSSPFRPIGAVPTQAFPPSA